MEFKDDSYDIIGAAMEVHNEVGPGLREKPYENALVIALRDKGFDVQPQKPYPIFFRGKIVGECQPDNHGQLIPFGRSQVNWRYRRQ